jgi:hypothetical protein
MVEIEMLMGEKNQQNPGEIEKIGGKKTARPSGCCR